MSEPTTAALSSRDSMHDSPSGRSNPETHFSVSPDGWHRQSGGGNSASVWLVWTESGEYENWSRDLRGVFLTRELAEAHAKQLGDDSDVIDEPILKALPENVPYIKWSAHIWPDGREAVGELGWYRGESYRTWSNEITPAEGRAGLWHGERSGKRDRFVEVVGFDEESVRLEYARLLAKMRSELEAETDA